MSSTGPLAGVKVVEVGGIGPNPFAGMLLADMGADVLRVDRPLGEGALRDPTLRGRQTIAIDLKRPSGVEVVLRLCERADALIEGYRPGVMERLGLGPGTVHARNARLVYGRMTGYGQDGPLASVAGHDINYLSVAGVLGAIRRAGDRPLAPLNLVADYGGGAMFLAFGVVCGILEARTSGRGQVVDAAMVDGAALLTSLFHGLRAQGQWSNEPGANLLDSGAHFYEVYGTADGGHIAVGPLEPQFYSRLLELLELDPGAFPQFDRTQWPVLKERFAAVFAARTTAAWGALLEGEEACATVVRGPFDEEHEHLRVRGTYVELDGLRQPGAAPRFSRTPAKARAAQTDPDAALERWGFDADVRETLREDGHLG